MAHAPDTTHRRVADRGSHDRDLAYAILDGARVAHVGFAVDGQPYVLPMAVARDGASLLLHGSVASRLMGALAGGAPCCVTVTHLDGLVLARSAFHSSMNYRSLMVFGVARAVEAPEDKAHGLDRLVEHLLPGRLVELRDSTRKELAATTLLSLPIETFSVKVRRGPPDEPTADRTLPIWAGVVPLHETAGEPVPAPDVAPDTPLPPSLRGGGGEGAA